MFSIDHIYLTLHSACEHPLWGLWILSPGHPPQIASICPVGALEHLSPGVVFGCRRRTRHLNLVLSQSTGLTWQEGRPRLFL